MVGRVLNKIAEPIAARWLLAVLLAILILFPWAAGEGGRYYTFLLMTVFIFATLGHAWNLLAGFCGLLSFGIQVYVGLAGFTVAILVYYVGVPVWWAMLLSIIPTVAFAWLLAAPVSGRHGRRNTWIGVIIAVILWIIYEIVIAYDPGADLFGSAYIRRVIFLFGIFLGALPLLKLQGAYFAVATWLIAAAVASIFNEWQVVGAGGGMNIANDTTMMGRYYAGLGLLVVASAVVWWLLGSKFGQALTAVRDDEEAATAIGVDIRRIKTMVFLISAPMAGLAAALYYIDAVTITPPDAFHIRWSAYAVFIVVAGGMGTLSGPIIGAVAFIIVQRFLVGIWGGGDLTLGIAAVLLILLLPRGIAGVLADLREGAAKTAPEPRALDLSAAQSNGRIVAAGLVPSSPALHLVPGTAAWRGLREGMSALSARIRDARPDAIVMLGTTPVPATHGRPAARLSGALRDPGTAALGDVVYDVEFDLPLGEALRSAGFSVHQPARSEDVTDAGAMAALAQIDPTRRIPVVVLDVSTRAEGLERVIAQSGRRVAVVALSGLTGSARRTDLNTDPGGLATVEDDRINRQILGWFQDGQRGADLNALARQSDIENDGTVLATAMTLLRGPARVLSYGAIFGAGAAVVDFSVEDGAG
ncbi:MAG: hypothetical protein AAGF79_15095 [Pseudomonadota bacterium]